MLEWKMTIPILVFGALLASLYGAVFHLWRDGGLGRLILYLVLSWAGFAAGELLGRALGWSFWSVGSLHLGMASVGSIVFLIVGYWLSLVQVESPGASRR
jgi:hypothetical protein